MRRRSAHVEPADRRAIAGPAWRGAQEEELLQRQLALEDVAFTQPELAFDIERREHLPMQDAVAQVGRELRDCLHHGVPKRFTLVVPGGSLQVVWGVLHEARHDVLARWSN